MAWLVRDYMGRQREVVLGLWPSRFSSANKSTLHSDPQSIQHNSGFYSQYQAIGLFYFMPKSHGRAGNQFIAAEEWEKLSEACHHHGLVPPNLSSDSITSTNTMFTCTNNSSVPWYHSSISLGELIRQNITPG